MPSRHELKNRLLPSSLSVSELQKFGKQFAVHSTMFISNFNCDLILPSFHTFPSTNEQDILDPYCQQKRWFQHVINAEYFTPYSLAALVVCQTLHNMACW